MYFFKYIFLSILAFHLRSISNRYHIRLKLLHNIVLSLRLCNNFVLEVCDLYQTFYTATSERSLIFSSSLFQNTKRERTNQANLLLGEVRRKAECMTVHGASMSFCKHLCIVNLNLLDI